MGKSIVEKLGIGPIEGGVLHHVYGYLPKDVEELETQRNEMLEVLLGMAEALEDEPGGWQYYNERMQEVIQKADPQHRIWEQIKEAMSE